MGAKHLLIILLVLLAACSEPAVRTVPTAQFVPSDINESIVENNVVENNVDLCAEKTCPAGQACRGGVCGCASGKLCNGECIPSGSCCSNADCSSENCVNGACEEAKQCRLGEALENGECACDSEHKFCQDQNKCVEKDNCCRHTDCGNFNRCVPKIWKASLCASTSDKRTCKILTDQNKSELFLIKGAEFRVQGTNWFNDGKVQFSLGNETIVLAKGQSFIHSTNVTFFSEGHEVLGGYCKPDEEDETDDED